MAEKPNSDIPWRRNLRLRNFDYSRRGGYFITICSHQKRCIFGNIQNSFVQLSAIGEIVNNNWLQIPKHTPRVEIGTFVVMPNHIHGILYIIDEEFGIEPTSIPRTKQKSPNIGAILGWFKMSVTRDVRITMPGVEVWQRNYYDHILRNEVDEQRIMEYIQMNPLRWANDEENPGRMR